MSKSFKDLMSGELMDDLKKYFVTYESLKQVINCVDTSRTESNVYKNIASFEDAQIVESSEIPVGDEKQKMAYLLDQATSTATTLLTENLNKVSDIVKLWNSDLVLENQDHRLKTALNKLKNPVKTQPIPTYSRMSEGQRQRTQAIFKKHLNSEEPVSIDYITDAIDRYNANASITVLSKALNVSIEFKNSVSVYDEENFLKVSSPEVLQHLALRFDSFRTVVETLSSTDKELSVEDFLTVLHTAEQNNNVNVSDKIASLTRNVDFMSPSDEYVGETKDTASHKTIEPHVGGINHLNPLTQNTLDRMNALCKVVSRLSDMKIPVIDLKQSTLNSEEAYAAMSTYFKFIEEFTQCLMVYMYVTQITVRNNTVLDEVISISERLVDKITSLFAEVNENLPEDGEVSQESISTAINFIKSKLKTAPKYSDLEEREMRYVLLEGRFNVLLKELDKYKLRGGDSLNVGSLDKFKRKHAKLVKTQIGKDISTMSANEVFNTITVNMFNDTNLFLQGTAVSMNLFNDKTPLATRMLDILESVDLVSDYFMAPFVTNSSKTISVCNLDLLDHLSNLEEDLKANDIPMVEKSLKAFDYFLSEGSYYTNVDKLSDKTALSTLTTVPKHPYTAVDGKVYTLGYGNVDRTSQEQLLALYGESKKPLTLNAVKFNSKIRSIAKNLTWFYAVNMITDDFNKGSKGYPSLAGMEKICDRLVRVKQSLNKVKLSSEFNSKLIDALILDVKGAISDATLRTRLVKLTNETANSLNQILTDVYIEHMLMIEDFIEAIK